MNEKFPLRETTDLSASKVFLAYKKLFVSDCNTKNLCKIHCHCNKHFLLGSDRKLIKLVDSNWIRYKVSQLRSYWDKI